MPDFRAGVEGVLRKQALHALVDGGHLAHMAHESALVLRCAKHVESCSDAGSAPSRAKMLAGLLRLSQQGNAFTSDGVKLRVSLLNEMTLALSQIKQDAQAPYTQEACALIWNAALPLLQPKLRGLLQRPLSVINDTLTEMQSSSLTLRISVLVELAKIAMDSDLHLVAQERLRSAIQLDSEAEFAEQLDDLEQMLAVQPSLII